MPFFFRAILISLMTGFILPATAGAVIHGEDVIYVSDEGTPLKGYLSYDSYDTGPRPGILLIHEWWGIDDFTREMADRFASEGYVVLAADMYGEGYKARIPHEASAFAKHVNNHPETARDRFAAGLELLKKDPRTDPLQIAATGFGFGGTTVLNAARQGFDLKAVISFYGRLESAIPEEEIDIRAPVLILLGEDDKNTPPQSRDVFRREMKNHNVDHKIMIYDNADYGFMNVQSDHYERVFGLGREYQETAARLGFRAAVLFLEKHLNHELEHQ